jgi:ABC-2 type transport system permease protein
MSHDGFTHHHICAYQPRAVSEDIIQSPGGSHFRETLMVVSTIRNFRLFLEGAYLSFIALFAWLAPPYYITTKLIGPATYMIFFVLLGRFIAGQNDASFYVIGNAILATSLSGIYGVSMSIDGDRWTRTLIYLFGTPANRFFMFFGRAFIHILDGMLGVVIGLLLGVILFRLDLSQSNLLGLALTILITNFSTAGLGLTLGCLGLITRNVMFVNNALFVMLWIFSGANISIDALPIWAQQVSTVLPLTRGVASARLVISGADLKEVMPLLSVELLIGLIYTFIGYFMFRQFEYQAKKRGTLEAF